MEKYSLNDGFYTI